MTPKGLLEAAKNGRTYSVAYELDAYPVIEKLDLIPILEAAEKMYQLLRLELIEWPMQKDAIEAWEKLK